MAHYRALVFSQDLDGDMLKNHSKSVSSAVLKDVTNKSFPCSCLPDETMTGTLYEGVEDFNLGDEIQNETYGLEFLRSKALLLQLSLSQTQKTTDPNLQSEAYCRLDSERPKNMKDHGNTVFNLAGQSQLSEKINAAMNSKEVTFTKQVVSPAVSQSIGSTDLSLPSAQQLEPIRGNNKLSVDESDQGHISKDKLPLISNDRKMSKSKNVSVLDEDIQAAVGLTVATAETLVIADIMNGCQMCQSLGPTAILDAALILRRERDALGLNEFVLQDLQGTSLADSKWEEDLDDTVLEAECFGTLWTDSMEDWTWRDSSRPANMQSRVCPVKTEIAVKTVTTRSTTVQHPEAQCEERSSDVNGVMQGTMTHSLPGLNDKTNEGVTSHKHIKAQVMAPNESFNSRWLGGWTGVKCAEGKQACSKGWQPEKRPNNGLKFETSELSETCGLPPPPTENVSKCLNDFQTKSAKCAVASMPEEDAEALSTGSCAEILLALSQASVKYSCSFQEPLCSFVPCSVNVKINPSSTEPPRCNDAESAEITTKKCIANGLVSGDNMGGEQHLREIYPTRGTKRTHLDSLRIHSTIFSNLQCTLQPVKNHSPKLIQDDGEMLNDNGADSTVKGAGSLVPPNKSVQCELILEESALQDSPPLIWHRGKRRRLRACRIAESALTQCTSSDSLSGSPPVDCHALASCSEPENMNFGEWENLREIQKDEAQLLSCGNQLRTNYHSSNGEPAVLQEHYNIRGTAKSHTNTKRKIYTRRERRGTSNQIFNGVSFLLTGFSASQKKIVEDLSKKVQEHGGVIMSSIPSFSSLNGQRRLLKQHTTSHSIVLAPQKVRTLKYLYGCAAGLLIVRPNWVDEMIAKKGLLFNHKCKGKGLQQFHVSACAERKRAKDLIFSMLAAYVHGQRSYCLKLSLLIQHGAGKVVRSMKGLMEVNNVEGSLIRVVVAEHQSKLSHIVKETAARSGLPIVSGDWIIDSLLNGRLLAFPIATESSKVVKGVMRSKTKIANKSNSAKRRQGIEGSLSFAKTIQDTVSVSHEKGNMMKPCVSLLGQGGTIPTLSSTELSFVLDIPKSSASRKLSSKLFHKSICMNGMIYTAGDIVEVRPETGEANEPYIAQIESFYAGHASSINMRSAKIVSKGEPEQPCFLCCRWFYRPSDTGFPCVSNGKELYLSQHFDDNAPVYSIIKKVQVLLVVGEKTFITDAERGWRKATQTSSTFEAADYICKFFYDYHKESLHQLKAALTSDGPI
ncbi:hypothetical protein GOP47_0013272 [Adiantum capillus-veneris]|uniref:BRCT domain-containing protein n=1 Tax=Adiantum capillus-veneris TaxID=13818 RepID=A0A9D4ZFM2_ADICA|nr:hypothetical protein GOP47_0013272 [Adiantum capillus-veneris]